MVTGVYRCTCPTNGPVGCLPYSSCRALSSCPSGNAGHRLQTRTQVQEAHHSHFHGLQGHAGGASRRCRCGRPRNRRPSAERRGLGPWCSALDLETRARRGLSVGFHVDAQRGAGFVELTTPSDRATAAERSSSAEVHSWKRRSSAGFWNHERSAVRAVAERRRARRPPLAGARRAGRTWHVPLNGGAALIC